MDNRNEDKRSAQESRQLTQVREMIDTARTGGHVDSKDLARVAGQLSGEDLNTAISYAGNFKGRGQLAKENLAAVRQVLMDEESERYNAAEPEKAENKAYFSTLEFFKVTNDNYVQNFDFDTYIADQQRRLDESVEQGRMGMAAEKRGVIRAATEVRDRLHNAESQTTERMFAVFGRNVGERSEYFPMDIETPAFVDSFDKATRLTKGELEYVMAEIPAAFPEIEWQVRDNSNRIYVDSRTMEHPQKQMEMKMEGMPDGTVQQAKQVPQNKVDVFKMDNGFWGVNETVDGVRSKTRRIEEADIREYFNGLKGQPKEEVDRRRAILADKYLHSNTQEKPKEQSQAQGFEPLAPEIRNRISTPSVFKMLDGVHYGVRTKIDGEQYSAKVMKRADVSAFFDGFSGLTKEEQGERKAQVAAKYFSEELNAPVQERGQGMKR